jgi:riboflavin kinase/FMN adenylyltransferase
VQHLEVGDDFRFGCDRVGDFDFLQQAGVTQGFTVEAAQTVELDGLRVSSTQVRNALAAADFALAERLLGRPYRIAGRVLHGQKLARQLGTPTANIQLKRRRVPLTGVYLVSVDIDGKSWPGVANIGVGPRLQVMARPTWKFIFGFCRRSV